MEKGAAVHQARVAAPTGAEGSGRLLDSCFLRWVNVGYPAVYIDVGPALINNPLLFLSGRLRLNGDRKLFRLKENQ